MLSLPGDVAVTPLDDVAVTPLDDVAVTPLGAKRLNNLQLLRIMRRTSLSIKLS